MSFWKKFANIASGGTLGMAQGIKNKNLKAIATGGMFGGGGGGGARRGVPASDEARAFFGQQSPEDQQAILQTLRGNPNGMNEWFENARAAGSVPQGGMMGGNAMSGGGMIEKAPLAMGKQVPNQAIMEAMRRRWGGGFR